MSYLLTSAPVCRETALLVNANESSISNERRVVLVIAHEMAHLVGLPAWPSSQAQGNDYLSFLHPDAIS